MAISGRKDGFLDNISCNNKVLILPEGNTDLDDISKSISDYQDILRYDFLDIEIDHVLNKMNFHPFPKNLFENLTDASGDGILLLDKNNIPVYFNKSLKKVSNCFYPDISLYSELSLNNEHADIDVLRNILNSNKGSREFTCLTEDSKKHLLINIKIIKSDANCSGYKKVIVEDITESKEYRDKLKENIRLLDKISKTLPFVIYLYDIEKNQKTLVNTEPFTEWGIHIEDSEIDKWVKTRIHPDDKERVQNHYNQLFNWSSDRTYTIETRFRKDDGDYIWIRTIDIPFTLEDGKENGILLGSIQNVTDQVKAEKIIRDSKERLELATKEANIGIFEWNFQDNNLIWNDSMYKLYEVDKNSFKPTYRSWLRRIREDQQEYITEMRKLVTEKDGRYNQILKIKTAQGIKYLQPAVKLIKDSNGKPVKLIGVNFDVTETTLQKEELDSHRNYLQTLVHSKTKELKEEISLRTLAEAELEKALDRQVDFNKNKNRFVQMISHEFRTPLTQITTSIDLLDLITKSFDSEGKSEKYIGVVKGGIEQMTDILSITSRFFYLQEQLIYPEIDRFDFINNMERSIKYLEDSGKIQKGIVAFSHSLNDRYFYSSAESLYSAFNQIIENAAKYSPADSHILIVATDFDDGIKVSIQDFGEGIKQNDMPFITELFRRGEDQQNVGKNRGLGVGLPIAKMTFEALQGTMKIESIYGEGTIVTVTLPNKPDIYRSKNKN
jgi:PAS domain S-box-containing protein